MKHLGLITLLICLGPTRILAEAPDSSWTRVAVILTSREGLPGDKPLQFAHVDGAKLRDLLLSLGQLPPENLFWENTEKAEEARRTVSEAADRIAALKSQGHRVFLQFYYSGHGAARHFHLGGDRLSFEEVRSTLSNGPEARMYVLDVCYGASFFATKGFDTAPPLRLQIDLDQSTRGEIVISSSAEAEQAFEVKTLGGSVFTSHWAMGLRGAGDRNRDGQVTLFEAYNYAYDRTVTTSTEELNRPQHPSFDIDLMGARDLLLSRPRNLPSGIVFSDCPAGSYSLIDQTRGLPVGDLRLPEVGEFSLALEPGRYFVAHNPPTGGARAATVEVSKGLRTLRYADFKVSSGSTAGSKGTDPGAYTLGDYMLTLPPLLKLSGATLGVALAVMESNSESPENQIWIAAAAGMLLEGIPNALLMRAFIRENPKNSAYWRKFVFYEEMILGSWVFMASAMALKNMNEDIYPPGQPVEKEDRFLSEGEMDRWILNVTLGISTGVVAISLINLIPFSSEKRPRLEAFIPMNEVEGGKTAAAGKGFGWKAVFPF